MLHLSFRHIIIHPERNFHNEENMASFPIRILAAASSEAVFKCHKNYGTDLRGFESCGHSRLLSQIITFLAPLIIIGLVASSIISVKKAPTPVTAPIVRIEPHFSMLETIGAVTGVGAFFTEIMEDATRPIMISGARKVII